MVDTKQTRGKRIEIGEASLFVVIFYITLSCLYPAVVDMVVLEPGEY